MYPFYPNPVLGDFGACIVVGRNDDMNPLGMTHFIKDALTLLTI